MGEPEEATPWAVMVKQMQVKQSAGIEDDIEYGEVNEDEEEEKMDIENKILDEGIEDDYEDNDEILDSTLLDELDENVPQEHKNGVQLLTAEEPKKKKKRKKREKCKICGDKGHRKMDCEMLPEERRKELKELFTMKVERKGKGTGRKKNKNKDENALPYENTSADTEVKSTTESTKPVIPTSRFANNTDQIRKTKKVRQDKSGQIVEDGEGMFQGFRVKMEDQQRLQKLFKQLKGTGMPKPELEATMKRERRIAEKSLARSKKLVCFNCRAPGHMLSDCPHAKTDIGQGASGHCFKCKQEGHLAKTCPDNPRGLYPKGGGCVFCGSVEHLKRDCPRKVEKDMKQGVRVGMIGDSSLEDEQV